MSVRRDEPRERAWILAGVGLGLPIVSYALVELANLAGWPRLAGALLPLLLVTFIVGAALSLAAMASGFAALLRAESPRPAWRYLEPWVLPLPFATLVAVFASGFGARPY
jgi:hypothetical protein